jgi:anti-anti-sigma factor
METWRCGVHCHQEDEVTVLTVAGRVGADGSSMLAHELKHQIDAGRRRVLVDLAGVDYMNSAGLRVLETAAGHLRQSGGALTLSGVREPVRLVLEMAGLNGLVAAKSV